MSENLKRAESLFNRIMNQNGANPAPSGKSGAPSKNPRHHSGGSGSSGYDSNGHSHKKHNNHHNSSHTNNHRLANLHIELPTKNPVKLAEEAMAQIPESHHVLPYCWTVWHHLRAKPRQRDDDASADPTNSDANNNNGNSGVSLDNSEGNAGESAAVAVNSYLQTTNEIEFPRMDVHGVLDSATTTTIGSLEQMWTSLSLLKKTYELPVGTELLVFKSGVNPVWEDPINAKGGRWVFRFSRRSPNGSDELLLNVRKKTSLIWERLLLKTMAGSIIPDTTYSEEIQDLICNDISGLALSVRKDDLIISIWNTNLNFNKKKQLQQGKEDEKKLTLFQARRIICDLILRVIRECKMIARGLDSIETVDGGLNERVYGVLFEYRLHSDNNAPNNGDKHGRRYQKYARED